MYILKTSKDRFSRRGYEEVLTKVFNNKTRVLFLSHNCICHLPPIFRCVIVNDDQQGATILSLLFLRACSLNSLYFTNTCTVC